MAANAWVDFHLLSDATLETRLPRNVIFHPMTLASLEMRLRRRIGLNVSLSALDSGARRPEYGGMSSAKTNDLKPMFGEVFGDTLLRRYEWWGYLQEDVLLGDLMLCVTPSLLERADVISPFVRPLNSSGVFMMLRNVPAVNRAWRRSADAPRVLSSPSYLVFDEWWGESRDNFAATLGREHDAGRLRVHTADRPQWWAHDLRERRPIAVCWRWLPDGRPALVVLAGRSLPALPCLGGGAATSAGGERCLFHFVQHKAEPTVSKVQVGRGAHRSRLVGSADEFALTRDGWWLPALATAASRAPAFVLLRRQEEPRRGSGAPPGAPALDAVFGAAELRAYLARLALCVDLDSMAATRKELSLERGWCARQADEASCAQDPSVRLRCAWSCDEPSCRPILPLPAADTHTAMARLSWGVVV